MNERPVLIGEAPGPSREDGDEPLSGRWERRMARVCSAAETDDEAEAWLQQFERRNLLAYYPGSVEGEDGSLFPPDLAAEAADGLREELEGRLVLLAGKRVARAFGLSKPDYFEPLPRAPAPGAVAWVVPHPSGINRWWNEPRNRMLARHFYEQLLGAEMEVG